MESKDWAERFPTPVGIGIDLVSVTELRKLDQRTTGAFSRHTFTDRELAEAEVSQDPWVYLAGRFAVKEAVFKAVAHLLSEKSFDFRLVETLRQPDGSPRIICSPALQAILDSANVSSLLVSISNEADFAVSMVQAVKRNEWR